MLKPMNWSYLHHGIVVWLNVDLAQLAIRLAGDQSRPLLAADASSTGEFSQTQLQKLQTLWAERQHLYQHADLEIAVTNTQTVDQVVEQILVKIPQILKQDL